MIIKMTQKMPTLCPPMIPWTVVGGEGGGASTNRCIIESLQRCFCAPGCLIDTALAHSCPPPLTGPLPGEDPRGGGVG